MKSAPTTRSRAFISKASLLALLSLVALAGIGVFLWAPWNRPRIASQKTLRLYCAAGVTQPVEEIAAAYRQAYGVTIAIDTAGTGELLSRLSAGGGRGDLFLSAEQSRITEAQQKGLVAEILPVAKLYPVLVVNRKTQERLKAEGKPVTGYNDLLRDDLKVVLGAESTSIGRLSKRMLEPLGVWKKLEDRRGSAGTKVSMQGTVNKVALDLRTVENSIGIIWDFLARQHAELEIIRIPDFESFYDELSLGVVAKSDDPTAALQFGRYLTASDKGLSILKKAGVATIDDGDTWAEHPTVHLSAGAMLKPGIDDLLKRFSQREGVTIITDYKGCGLLVSQMQAVRRGDDKTKAFPDAYFSCDVSFMDMVKQWFDASTLITQNDMIIAVQKGNPKRITSLSDLARPELRIGLAHPTNSALGKLTDDMLKKLGLHDGVYAGDWKSRILHDNEGSALVNKLTAASERLDAAVVYRSNYQSAGEAARNQLQIIEPNTAEAIATQPFAIAKDSQHRHLMKRLLAEILKPQSADHFKSLGFHWIYSAQ